MKKSKKIIFSFLAVFVAAVLIFGGYLGYRMYFNAPETEHDYSEIYSKGDISYDVDSDGKFSVLKINDTHFFDGVCENDKRTVDELKIILDKTPCDLVIVNGDMVDGFNLKASYDKYQATEIFAELLESYDVPWTFAPGNNDNEIDGENEDLIAFMMQYDNFICGNEKNVDGSVQFFIDLEYNGELAHTIAVMDSHARTVKAIGGYDYIKQSQIDWLLKGVNERRVKTSIYFHMPTPAFETAYTEGVPFEEFPMYDTYPYDDIKKNELFDNAIKDNEYISLISTGHVHSNDMCSLYNGIYYQLSSVSGYSAFRDSFITPSCTLTEIDVTADSVADLYRFEKVYA